jgi:hypothetical protein
MRFTCCTQPTWARKDKKRTVHRSNTLKEHRQGQRRDGLALFYSDMLQQHSNSTNNNSKTANYLSQIKPTSQTNSINSINSINSLQAIKSISTSFKSNL